MVHVIQHDDIRAGIYRLPGHLQILHFHFDFPNKRRILLGHCNRLCHAAGRLDMVILQHHAVGKVVPMVASATDSHRVLLKNPVVRCGLPRIQQTNAGSLQQVRNLTGMCRHAAHALQIVQRRPLAGQQHPDIPPNVRQLLTLLHLIAILHVSDNLRLRIQQGEHPLKNLQTTDHAVLLADQLHVPRALVPHDAVGGHIFTGNILPQRAENQRLHVQLHCRSIKHLFPLFR